jgi:predicted PurR-regulated permease PerM
MNTAQRCELASWCLAALTLFLILKLKLLAALMGGLFAHELIHSAAPSFSLSGASLKARKLIVLFLLVAAIGAIATGVGLGVAALTAHGPESLGALMQKMADLIETARGRLPAFVQGYLPGTAAEVESVVSGWLREHSATVKTAGENVGRGVLHVAAGILIGCLMAFAPNSPTETDRPLVRAFKARTATLAASFRRYVFAQVRISALNTLFTAIYLAVVLPLFGVHLPLVKTMIAVTFLAGLLPLVGNLISNTVIVVLSLGDSLGAATASLVYLVTIHKLEYLVNARIIGTQIRAHTWEILLAMLAMESLFGLPGLVAAPVYYSYLKDELSAKELV